MKIFVIIYLNNAKINLSGGNMAEYGLVLSSDGAKSSFEIGTWKALRELNVSIPAVAGSFAGALNAALIAQGDFVKAVSFWRNVSAKDLFYVNRHIAEKYSDEWSKADTKQFKRSFLSYVQGRSEQLTPLKEVVERFINEDAVRKSDTKLGFVSVSLANLEADMITLNKIPRGKLSEYLMAAACFPQIAHVDRAKDPQFSSEYSPYIIIQNAGVDNILSTDEIIIIPPKLRANVTLICSSEAMELVMNESVEKMRSNIKLGYIDTLRMFKKSLGNTYLILPKSRDEFDAFTSNIGRELPMHLNDLVRVLLRIKTVSKGTVEAKLAALLTSGGIKYSELQISLLELIAKFLGVKNDEKYTLDKLMQAVLSEAKKRFVEVKEDLLKHNDIKETLENVVDAGKNIPDAYLFVKYFVILISAKPNQYDKFRVFLEFIHPKTTAALVGLLYLFYL